MSVQNLIDETKKRAAWSIFMGVLTAALGAFLIVYPLATAKFTTVVLGWVLILVGIAQFVFALHSQKPGGFFPKSAAIMVLKAVGCWKSGAVKAVFWFRLKLLAGRSPASSFRLSPAKERGNV